jgi:hypothetical protein
MHSGVHIRSKTFQINSRGVNNSIGLSIVIVPIRFRVYHVHILQRNEQECVVSLNDDLVNGEAS